MTERLKVLILEDNPSDAELVTSALKRAGLAFDLSRAQDEAGYRLALEEPLDLILADYSLPQFNALEALRILQGMDLDIPFIVVTGTIEEAAIECMKLGAADYLLKDRLGRLGPAIDHALEQKRLRAEIGASTEQLRESEERYRRLAENAVDIIYRYELVPEPRFEYVSPAAKEVVGYTPDEYYADPQLGQRIVHPDDAHLEAKAAVSDEEPLVVRWIHKDGHIVWIEQRRALIRDEDGTPTAIEGIARDVTATRELEQRKSDFTSMISHELRTPLTVIIGDATLLTRDEIRSDPEKVAGSASRMLRRGHEMVQLVDDLLNVAKIQSSGLTLALEEVDISKDLAACVQAVPAGRERELVLDIPSDLPMVVCDPDRLCYAVANLLRNAVKFSPDGGTILLKARAEKGTLSVSVTDHGVGIPPEEHGRVFDRFTQADMSATRPFGGFGMGLFISKSVVEAHGGRISVDSAPGKGSTFTIEIPLKPGGPVG